MTYPLARRDAAEAIEQFGDDLAALCRKLDRLCERVSGDVTDRINAVPMQDQLDVIAEGFRKLGDEMAREMESGG